MIQFPGIWKRREAQAAVLRRRKRTKRGILRAGVHINSIAAFTAEPARRILVAAAEVEVGPRGGQIGMRITSTRIIWVVLALVGFHVALYQGGASKDLPPFTLRGSASRLPWSRS